MSNVSSTAPFHCISLFACQWQLLSSADNLYEQSRPRPGWTKCHPNLDPRCFIMDTITRRPNTARKLCSRQRDSALEARETEESEFVSLL